MKQLLLITTVLLLVVGAKAQQVQEDRYSTTPFVFNDFREAKINFAFGRKGTAKANIFLRDASLIFLKGDKKMKADLLPVIEVTFGDSIYRKTGDCLGLVVAQKDGKYLLEVTTVDTEAIREAQRRNENTGFLDLPEFNVFIETDGDYFGDTRVPKYPLKAQYLFMMNGESFAASEKEVKKHLRSDKKGDFKELMKDRFWSWKDAKSLSVLLDYL